MRPMYLIALLALTTGCATTHEKDVKATSVDEDIEYCKENLPEVDCEEWALNRADERDELRKKERNTREAGWVVFDTITDLAF